MQIGLAALGGSHWIAGVQYMQSLIFGNSLLPMEEQAALRLYLDFEISPLDYVEVLEIALGDVTDFSRRHPFPGKKDGRFAGKLSSAPLPSLPARDCRGAPPKLNGRFFVVLLIKD